MCPQLPCASPVSNPRLDPPAYGKEGALQGVQKNVLIEKKYPKLSAVGLSLTMNMTWEGLIRLREGCK